MRTAFFNRWEGLSGKYVRRKQLEWNLALYPKCYIRNYLIRAFIKWLRVAFHTECRGFKPILDLDFICRNVFLSQKTAVSDECNGSLTILRCCKSRSSLASTHLSACELYHCRPINMVIPMGHVRIHSSPNKEYFCWTMALSCSLYDSASRQSMSTASGT